MPNITSAELRVLKALWRLENGTVRDVKEALESEGGEPPAYTTVMTLMSQLAQKGVLAVDKLRQPFVYTPKLHREQVLSERLRDFLSTVFDGQAGELVLRLVEQADLSEEDLRRIEARIEKHQGSREAGADEGSEGRR